MIQYREERPGDVPAREALLDAAFGPGRHRKTCAKLRRGRAPAQGLALVAEHEGTLVGTIRLWHVASASGHDMLLLGPVAVDDAYRCYGIGGALIRLAIEKAAMLGHKAIMLVGDAPYYVRFGFGHDVVAEIALPGPVEIDRVLGIELLPGGLAGATGLLRATGERTKKPAKLARPALAA